MNFVALNDTKDHTGYAVGGGVEQAFGRWSSLDKILYSRRSSIQVDGPVDAGTFGLASAAINPRLRSVTTPSAMCSAIVTAEAAILLLRRTSNSTCETAGRGRSTRPAASQLPAPPDSKFSADEFVLGTKGLKPMLAKLIDGTGGALYPLGTWHNHLSTSGPSGKDMRTGILLSGL